MAGEPIPQLDAHQSRKMAPGTIFVDASVLAVAPALDQPVDQARIGEGRGIAEASEIVLRDLAQDAAHDLAAPGLGKPRREVDEVRAGDRADLGADVAAQLDFQGFAALLAL